MLSIIVAKAKNNVIGKNDELIMKLPAESKKFRELTEGKNSRIHKSIFSSRADLKQANNKIENFIVNILEPVLSISYSLGNRYPHEELAEIWKLMFAKQSTSQICAQAVAMVWCS